MTRAIPTESVEIARAFLALQDVCKADPFHDAAVQYLKAKALVEGVTVGEPEISPQNRPSYARSLEWRTEALRAFRAEVAPLLDGSSS
jgi:hypothetical protein